MIKTILFDLDGTLLPMDLEVFIKSYFHAIQLKFEALRGNGELILKGVLRGTQEMMKSHPNQSNEDVFWKCFEACVSISKNEIEQDFEAFYKNEFTQLGKVCRQNENMVKAVSILREKGYQLLLTTNPMFPKIAVEERLKWAGIQANNFELITSYEDCHATKPSIDYYTEVIDKMHLIKEECMMVGNDSKDDGIIETLGIPLYLVEDHLIDHNEAVKSRWLGSSSEFLKFVDDLPKLV